MATEKDQLCAYRKRRNLSKSPEPCGDKKKMPKDNKKRPACVTKKFNGAQERAVFVIQKHDARQVHYDFRLEIDGVLVSWAVPKGTPTDPREKRLAIRTDDHPMAYAEFEGVIPAGNYGAGTVMVWDYGFYENIKKENGKLVSMGDCLKRGQIEVIVHGKKISGAYALIKTRWSISHKNNWLLIKIKDEHADARRNPVSMQQRSALTGRTMRQIAQEEGNNG